MRPVLSKNLPTENTAQSNIQRGVAVRVILMTASFTEKLMTIAIRLFNVTAIRATLTGMLRVNFYDLKAIASRFVLGKLLKLESGPFVNVPTLFFSQIATVTNPRKTFNCNGWIARFSGKFDNPFGDNVHGIFGESRLLSALPFQNTPYRARVRLCLLPLEAGAGLLVTASDMLKPSTAKELYTFAIGHSGNVVNTPIHADNGVVGLVNVGDGLGKGYGQKDLAFLDKEATVTQRPIVKIVLQLWRGLIGNAFNPTFDSRDAQPVFSKAKVPASDSTLQTDGGVIESNRLSRLLFKFSQGEILGRYLAKATNQDLGRKVKSIPHIVISQPLQLGRISDATIIKSYLTGPVTSEIPFLNCAPGKVNIKLNFEFDCSGNVHEDIIAWFLVESKSIYSGGVRRNSPPLRGFCGNR